MVSKHVTMREPLSRGLGTLTFACHVAWTWGQWSVFLAKVEPVQNFLFHPSLPDALVRRLLQNETTAPPRTGAQLKPISTPSNQDQGTPTKHNLARTARGSSRYAITLIAQSSCPVDSLHCRSTKDTSLVTCCFQPWHSLSVAYY